MPKPQSPTEYVINRTILLVALVISLAAFGMLALPVFCGVVGAIAKYLFFWPAIDIWVKGNLLYLVRIGGWGGIIVGLIYWFNGRKKNG
jgi:hypothetical protein